jgi:outer membrane receptor protein involved in Fe transport
LVLGASLAAGSASAQNEPVQTGLEVVVTAKRLDLERSSIQPSLGATRYEFTKSMIENIPQGENAPLGQVLLRAPGVVQDGFGQIHVRGDHGNVQYRLDGVQLPEGLQLFNNTLATRFVHQMSLITGALPAQYGLRTAGVVDIALKSGTTDPGAEASMTVGSRDYLQPAFQYGGRSGAIDYFAAGQFLHNGIGIENPTASYKPLHDDTDQWYALGKVTGIVDENTRVSLIAGGSSSRFQIPNVPGQNPAFTVNGISDWNSSLLDQRQWEKTYFGIASLQKHYDTLDLQLSGFARYSSLTYKPDALGDLLYNGIAPWTRRTSLTTGVQADSSWKAASNHTLRGGFLVQRERATSLTNANTLPAATPTFDEDGNPIEGGPAFSDQPVGFTDGFDLVGWTYSVYLQDEWKVIPNVTVNFGGRFDAINAATQESQFSPRVNVVWEPDPRVALRGGYARYFTPPPLAQVNANALAVRTNTSAAPEVTQNDPVKAERADYFDLGITAKPLEGLTLGFSAYYKIAQNLLDEGQFGAPIALTSFNYANATVRGIEFQASYDQGPWSLYGNIAWSRAIANNIVSSQFNFGQAELDYISAFNIFQDHDQSWTGSAGAAYVFNQDSDRATRLSADVLYGAGLRTTVITPNDTALPNYATLNLSLAQKIPISVGKGTQLRLDVLNVTDGSYQLRSGQGVGVGAPQYGMRRTFLVTLAQKF